MKISVVIGILFVIGLPFVVLASPPSQEHVQEILDRALSEADHVVVIHHWMPYVGPPDEKLRHMTVHEISSKMEVLALAKYFSIRLPPLQRLVVDGQECWTRVGFSVSTLESFEVIVSSEANVLLNFSILGDDCIRSDALLRDSAITVDKEALAPFYKRLKLFSEIKQANQAPLPMPMSVTAPARQEPRQP